MQTYVKERIAILIAWITNKIRAFKEVDEFVGICGSLSRYLDIICLIYPVLYERRTSFTYYVASNGVCAQTDKNQQDLRELKVLKINTHEVQFSALYFHLKQSIVH